MRNLICLLLAVGMLVVIVSCDVNPSKMTNKYAQELANKLTYTKDHRTGLCFAVITSRKTGSTDQTGLGMTVVPCEKIAHLIK